MNTTLKVVLIVVGTLFAAVVLLGAGMIIGRFVFGAGGSWMPMQGFTNPFAARGDRNFGPGMMQGNFESEGNFDGCPNNGGFNMGRGMMGGWGRNDETCGGTFDRSQGRGPGMMWNFDTQPETNADPISIEQAQDAVNDFLRSYGEDDLVLAEVMIFDNHAYAEIIEESTGYGAMEVLIDPVSLTVYPEHGPNMMWNQKYSQMGRGGMMGGFQRSDASPEEMPVSAQEAVEAAQVYLDGSDSGLEVEDHVDTFYGYYTLHTFKDGEVEGMLSVNGYTGNVFLHSWHGDFIEMQEFAEESHD